MNSRGSILVAFLKLITFLTFLAVVLKVSINYAEIVLSEYFNRQEVEVPDFTGKPLHEVMIAARDARLRVEVIKRQTDNNVPAEGVVSQNPWPGTIVKADRAVEVIVSTGASQDKAPDLRGKNVMDTPFLIQKAGFQMGARSYIHHETAAEKTVIAQTPEANALAPRGGRIDLLVSLGKSRHAVRVPDLQGRRVEAARAALAALGLALGDVGYRAAPGKPEFTVLEQEPKAGANVGPGAVVTLIASRGVSVDPGDPAVDDGRVRIVKFTVPPGSGAREVKMWLQDETGTRELYRNSHYPTEEIDISVTAVGEAKVLIYLDGSLFDERAFRGSK